MVCDKDSFDVGRLMARRLLRTDINYIQEECEDFSLIMYDYHSSRGKLIVICNTNSLNNVKSFIENQALEFLNYLKKRSGRSFYMKEARIMVFMFL